MRIGPSGEAQIKLPPTEERMVLSSSSVTQEPWVKFVWGVFPGTFPGTHGVPAAKPAIVAEVRLAGIAEQRAGVGEHAALQANFAR